MNRRGMVGWLAIALLASACGDPELKARLDDGSGLKAGAKVFVNGVEIGKVKSVAVQGDAVEVTFNVERKHQLTPHADACAYALPVREEGTLYVRLGSQGELPKGAALPQCHLVGDAIKSAVKEVGGAMSDALDAFISKVTPKEVAAPCLKVSARLLSVRAADDRQNATRVQLEVINDSDTHLMMPSVDTARFLDGKRAVYPVANELGGSLWSLPFSVPAHGKTAVGVFINQSDAQPKWLEGTVEYGFLNTCKVSLELKGP